MMYLYMYKRSLIVFTTLCTIIIIIGVWDAFILSINCSMYDYDLFV